MQGTKRAWVPPPQAWLHTPHSPACQAYTSQAAVLQACSSFCWEEAGQAAPAGATQAAVRVALPPSQVALQALQGEYCQ